MKNRPAGKLSAGFTLVELLVVIVILTILAAILIPAIFRAQIVARQAAIGLEIGDMKQALNRYKIEVGDYPPNLWDVATATAHVRLKFRNWDATNDPLPSPAPDAAQALVFWLRGFKNDSVRPIGTGTDMTGRTSYYDFVPTRLVTGPNNYPMYVPPGVNVSSSPPYVYFENRAYGDKTNAKYTPPAGRGTGTVTAYGGTQAPLAGATVAFAEPTTFQIICAGLDGDFGTAADPGNKVSPTGTNYSRGDRDNITVFTNGKTLEDLIR